MSGYILLQLNDCMLETDPMLLAGVRVHEHGDPPVKATNLGVGIKKKFGRRQMIIKFEDSLLTQSRGSSYVPLLRLIHLNLQFNC